MLPRLRSHLTYANVVSTICLFIVLSGSAYAAAKITGKNVKNGSLTGADVKDNSLTGKDVKSLSASDFKRGALSAGPRGATGPRGPTGPTGPGVGPTEATHLVQGTGTADCSSGLPTGTFCENETTLGGGASNTGSAAAPVGYFIDASGVVHLQGTVRLTYGSGVCCDAATVFILPPGYRPTDGERYFDDPPNARIVVQPDGRIKATQAGDHPLDGISFRP